MEKFGNLKEFLAADRVFEIPPYQRYYAWEKEQWEDLWQDLLYLEGDKKHYFGTILAKEKSEFKKCGLKSFEVKEIIDGQQRLTTIVILLKEIISQLEKIGDEEVKNQLDELRKSYLKYGENIYKLELLGNDRDFFCKFIIDDITYPDEILTPSQKGLKDAKNFFRNKLEKIKEEKSQNEFKYFLAEMIKKIENLEIVKYLVGSDSDAVLIFETVNDRGKPLSSLEKTKSFLMHTAYLAAPEEVELHLRKVNDHFSKIYKYLQEIADSKRGKKLFIEEDDIQRYHFIIYESHDKQTSHKYLNVLKGKVRKLYREDKPKALKYVLEYVANLERAFFAFKEIVTYQEGDKVEDQLNKIFMLRRVAPFYPLLITTWTKFKNEKEKMEEILKLIETFVFRTYAICGRRADAGESSFYSLAYRVHKGELEFHEIKEKLRVEIEFYADDERFELGSHDSNFYEEMPASDIKYLLFEYENHLREEAKEPLNIGLKKILSQEYTIEHIWPKNPLNIPEDSRGIHEKYKHRLGNLTIASKSWNSRWGTSPFNSKKREYINSVLRIQKELSNYPAWGNEQIEERETRIVKFALKRWKI